jgi:hypothetical protein
LRFHEALCRLRSLGSIDGRLLPGQRRDGVRKQLRAKSVSILQSEVLGPVRGGLSEMRPWCRDHLQYVVQPKGCPLTRNAQTPQIFARLRAGQPLDRSDGQGIAASDCRQAASYRDYDLDRGLHRGSLQRSLQPSAPLTSRGRLKQRQDIRR